jgi:hypothetical protein
MKLAFFDDFQLGVIASGSVVDVTDIVKDISRLVRGCGRKKARASRSRR